jgi:glutamate synthase domain-containing protein 2
MEIDGITRFVTFAIFALLLVMLLGPPVVAAGLYLSDRRQTQHAVLRNFPILGRLRYLLEHVGPELRQYLFDADLEGKPFPREDYRGIVLAGKYMNTLISFGSKRDCDEPGWYLRNALLPTLVAASGLRSPTRFVRKHAVYRGPFGRTFGAEELFPYPEATE